MGQDRQGGRASSPSDRPAGGQPLGARLPALPALKGSNPVKAIRIGTGAGFSGDRIEPAVELAEKGELDYLVFECLAERTIALAQQAKLKDPAQGYDPLLVERMRAVLPACRAKGIRIITNMGAANPRRRRREGQGDRPLVGPRRDQDRRRHRRRRAGGGAGWRLPARRDRRAGRHARQPARLGQRLPRRPAHRGSAGGRRRRRRHRPRGRSGDVPGAADPRVRLVDGGLDPARARHGRRPPAGVRRARSPAATSPIPASRTSPTSRAWASPSRKWRRTGPR